MQHHLRLSTQAFRPRRLSIKIADDNMRSLRRVQNSGVEALWDAGDMIALHALLTEALSNGCLPPFYCGKYEVHVTFCQGCYPELYLDRVFVGVIRSWKPVDEEEAII